MVGSFCHPLSLHFLAVAWLGSRRIQFEEAEAKKKMHIIKRSFDDDELEAIETKTKKIGARAGGSRRRRGRRR